MTATTIRQKLYDYIRVAEDKKVKAIYTMLEGEIEEVYDHWKDKDFVADLDKRSADYKKSKIKGTSWEDARSSILNTPKQKKK